MVWFILQSCGVAIYVKSSYSVSVITSPSNLEFILISTSISKGNFPCSIGLFYRPPNNHSSLDNLIDFLSNLSYSHISNLILTGDFNINFLVPSPQLTKLLDFTNSIGLSQIIQEPTHFSHSGTYTPSTIDLFFLPSNIEYSQSVLPPLSSSNHLSLYVQICLKQSCSQICSPRRKIWQYKHGDFKAANALLSSISWDSLLPTSDANLSCSIFTKTFLEVMHYTVPTKYVSPNISPPWANDHLLCCIHKRNFLFAKAKKTKSPLLFSQYRLYRNKTLSYQHYLKNAYFNQLSSSCSTPKMFWSLFKKLKKKPTIPSLSHNGSLASSPLSKANMINTFFSSCLNTSVAPLSLHSHLDFSIGDCPNELLCEVKSIVDLLLKIPSDTSSGPDGISARMLLATAHSISLPLVMIFNCSVKSGYFPDVWKTSHVIPIPKQNSAYSSPSSYRPIPLLPLVSKVFERHIFNWLLNFC